MWAADGRGQRYSWKRGLVEHLLARVYRGNWAGRVWGALPGRSRVSLIRHRLALLPAGVPPLRLGFASDLHAGPTTPGAVLSRAADLLRAEAVDVLLLGGDYVFLEADEERLSVLGSTVRAMGGRRSIGVYGNHDLWTWDERVGGTLADAGVCVVVNGNVRLDPPHERVVVVCLDDPTAGEPNPDVAWAGVRSDDVVIVLCHAPDGEALIGERSCHLMVCGHTHGGQVALPGGRPIVLPGRSKRVAGLYERPGGWLNVSRGLGGVEVPVRTFAPPDVVVFELH